MLIRFSVSNFKSFNERQELTMLPGKGLKKHKDHVIDFNDISLLKNATIYGANAAGKSNLVEAISYAKHVITKQMPNETRKMYCRVFSENKEKVTKFEFEIAKADKFFAYGFSMVMSEMKIRSEWVYELFPGKDNHKMLFERDVKEGRIELNKELDLTDEDKTKFSAYKSDFGLNDELLFMNEINREKKIGVESKLFFFKNIYEWFYDDLKTFTPDQPITNFVYFFDKDEAKKISSIIRKFDTGISEISIKEISINEFKEEMPGKFADEFLDLYKHKIKETPEDSDGMLTLRTSEAFFSLRGRRGEKPHITTIMMKHETKSTEYKFSEESDGTRRLFDLLDILISGDKNKIFVIDEMERSLHPKLTYKFLELFFDSLKENKTQLIFTTHESAIMDLDLLRRDEIWFVERTEKGASKLYSLDRFRERYDKKVGKAYLEGRYGAIPVFKNFEYEECD